MKLTDLIREATNGPSLQFFERIGKGGITKYERELRQHLATSIDYTVAFGGQPDTPTHILSELQKTIDDPGREFVHMDPDQQAKYNTGTISDMAQKMMNEYRKYLDTAEGFADLL
jgi:hypothetical protein